MPSGTSINRLDIIELVHVYDDTRLTDLHSYTISLVLLRAWQQNCANNGNATESN
jgi:hypothetical protein